MSEGLTDQGPYTRGSCNVMMGVEDTCFGPLKKGPKRVLKLVVLRVVGHEVSRVGIQRWYQNRPPNFMVLGGLAKTYQHE